MHDGTFSEYTSESCALYALHCKEIIPIEDVCYDPFECDQIGIVATAQVTSRMSGQSGLFSIQTDPCVPFDKLYESSADNTNQRWVNKFEISADVREDIFNILHRIGIRTASIYPDLDGLSSEIRQKQEHGCSQISMNSPR